LRSIFLHFGKSKKDTQIFNLGHHPNLGRLDRFREIGPIFPVSRLQEVRAHPRKRAALALVPLTAVVIVISLNAPFDRSGPDQGKIRLALAAVAAASLAGSWIIAIKEPKGRPVSPKI
jgi:hypothetical protein